MKDVEILIAGAGSVGCYLGAWLARAGARVSFWGRERSQARLGQGLRLTSLDGRQLHLQSPKVVSTLSGSYSLVVLACKRPATAEVIAALKPHLGAHGLILVAQNGLDAAREVAALSGVRALPLMVPFNLTWLGPGHLHRASGGTLMLPGDAELAPLCRALAQGSDCRQVADMEAVLAGKLLLNLNNAINGLCGLPLKEELSRRGYRLLLAGAQEEALAVMRARGLRPARLTAVPPAWLPRVLRLPDGLFRVLAGKLLAMDPSARSSLYDDLAAARPTEIADLNGWVLAEGKRLGIATPINARLTTLTRQAEAEGRAPSLTPQQIAGH
ncbi:2-dehydropantoate 2-reductase [Gallaecimonas sp. GXIMD4217]|uniref:2-dehydropantoate 2-reductase n=1 Tax=Gallaecimonas sp. GXIMD4217 TaxID=3131927 RepID=UPI00311B3375